MPWTDDDLAKRLLTDGVAAFEILLAPEPTPTVEAAARAFLVDVDDIVKSVLFEDRDAKGVFLLVLARGLSRVDPAKLAAAAPGRWKLASAADVERVTGYAAGTVPPAGHATRLDVVMDARVAAMDELVGGGGSPRASLRIARADVARLTGARVADVAAE